MSYGSWLCLSKAMNNYASEEKLLEMIDAGAYVGESEMIDVFDKIPRYKRMVKIFLNAGADVNMNECGTTYLILAAQHISFKTAFRPLIKCIKTLIDYRIDVDTETLRTETTTLSLACYNWEYDGGLMLKTVLDTGSNVMYRTDTFGTCVRQIACRSWYNCNAVKMLIEADF